ncbi:hypothetical protein [Streptomyces sp. ME19-01-6]|uniref:hypothetical protein n=1 Tax=Streptomyces sp. ME19-01-6 TaxID=3028686 RepID=UPI0029BC448D|nr:hypothetical protein [Streptomyces sp. ME19-01-6]MDX3224658.1 hypothetical protein [Streptomyces sp. ME19-01-6]
MSTHTYTPPTSSASRPAWRRWSPLVPVLVVASAGLLAASAAFDGDTFQHCEYLGPSTRMYLTAWSAPLCSVAALLLLWALHRGARRRGQRLGVSVSGRLAMAAGCLVPLLLLVQLVVLWATYQPDPSGGNDCSGLGALLSGLTA